MQHLPIQCNWQTGSSTPAKTLVCDIMGKSQTLNFCNYTHMVGAFSNELHLSKLYFRTWQSTFTEQDGKFANISYPHRDFHIQHQLNSQLKCLAT